MNSPEKTPVSTTASATTTLTYESLLTGGAALLASEGLTEQPVANLLSALRLWMRTHGFTPNRLVRDDFAGNFDNLLVKFADGISTRLKERTQRDRQEQMLRWQRTAQQLSRTDCLPPSFVDALRVAISASGKTPRAVARETGIAISTLANWFEGNVLPRGLTVAQIPALEHALGLPDTTLLVRLPATRRNRYERSGLPKSRTSAFTQRRKSQRYVTGNYWPEFAGRLAEEWAGVLSLKTDIHRDHGTHHNSWRLKSPENTALRIKPWMIHNGLICATAGVQFGQIAGYIGWLSLPKPQGAGFAKVEANTLAWLADADRLLAHARWLAMRSGNQVHHGVTVFLQTVCSYLRPETGYLWLNPQLRHNLRALEPQVCFWVHGIESDTAWQSHCNAVAKKLRAHLRRQLPAGQRPRYSRDPAERAAVVLNNSAPLKLLVMFLHRLRSSPPPLAHERDHRAWLRDVVLCELMVRNPLRSETYAAMTWRTDGTGNLIRTGSASFRIKLPPEAFKNQKGAAGNMYEVEVDPSVAPWINRYLAEARPYMPDAQSTDRFLLPAAVGPRSVNPLVSAAGVQQPVGYTGAGLSQRLQVLTALYIDNCPGFGSHAFRHIVATDYLIRHPGDYMSVALLLHDKLDTVLQNYAHLTTGHGLRSLSCDIAQLESSLTTPPTLTS